MKTILAITVPVIALIGLASLALTGTATAAQGEALATKHLRLVKGSHIVVPRCFEHDHAYIFQNPDKRIIFAIPYEGHFTLIGTTDEEIHGDPQQARISAAEVNYLCEQASRYFTRPITPADVVWSYSGVRPLLDDESGDPSAVTRDYLLESNVLSASHYAPLLSVWGGKITTFRKLAEDAAATIERVNGYDLEGIKDESTREQILGSVAKRSALVFGWSEQGESTSVSINLLGSMPDKFHVEHVVSEPSDK